MENETQFKIALSISLVAFLAVRLYYRIKTKTLGKESVPTDNRLFVMMLVFILFGTLSGMLVWLIDSDLMTWSDLPLPEWLRWSGVALVVVATALLGSVHQILGRNYSPKLEIRVRHKLITTGPL